MITIENILIYILEGIAITVAIYIVTRRTIKMNEIIILALSISASIFVLDILATKIGAGFRQGAGFGLGFMQVAGNAHTLPSQYFGSEHVVEGMDDPIAKQYYEKHNPIQDTEAIIAQPQPNLIKTEKSTSEQEPSIILDQYSKSPFDTDKYAPYTSE